MPVHNCISDHNRTKAQGKLARYFFKSVATAIWTRLGDIRTLGFTHHLLVYLEADPTSWNWSNRQLIDYLHSFQVKEEAYVRIRKDVRERIMGSNFLGGRRNKHIKFFLPRGPSLPEDKLLESCFWASQYESEYFQKAEPATFESRTRVQLERIYFQVLLIVERSSGEYIGELNELQAGWVMEMDYKDMYKALLDPFLTYVGASWFWTWIVLSMAARA